MQKDSLTYDSAGQRPLPEWLRKQKEGLNTIQPTKIVMKEDKSLGISLIVTFVLVLLIVAFLTYFIIRKRKD